MEYTQPEIDYLLTHNSPEEIKSFVQLRALARWNTCDCKGTLEMATGTGKTRVAINAIDNFCDKIKDPLIYVVVPTETLRDVDWPNEFREAGKGYLIEKVKLLCYASLDNERPLRDVDLIILDEIHHLTVLNASFFNKDHKVNRIMGLTATLPDELGGDNDRDKRLLIDKYAPSIFKVPIELAIKLKLVSDFEVTVLKFDLDDTDHYIAANVNGKKVMVTEKFRYKQLTKAVQRAVFDKKKEWSKFPAIQKRTDFIYNLRSKTNLAREVMESVMKDGTRTLIFCGSIIQSEQLCGKQVYNSGTTDEQLVAFNAKEIAYLGAVDALNEGVNISLLDQILINQLKSKERRLIQQIGRSIRFREDHIGKVIMLVVKGTVDEKWYDSSTKNFDRSRIKEYYVKPKSGNAVVAGK